MAYLVELTERVRQALAHVPGVKEKRMFGGVAFMVNGKMAVTVGDHKDHQMMVRVDPAEYPRAVQRKGAQPARMRGREIRGYVFLRQEAVGTKRQLDSWVGLALRFNTQAERIGSRRR